MKRFTNKQECLDWLAENYGTKEQAIYDVGTEWVCFDLNETICEKSITKAFESKHTDLDSKQQLEQRVVESFRPNDGAVYCGEVSKLARDEFDAIEKQNKYTRNLKGVKCDVYDVLKAFNVTCPALQHLIKKSLCAGLRGHKDKSQDLKDILDSAKRAIELNDVEVE